MSLSCVHYVWRFCVPTTLQTVFIMKWVFIAVTWHPSKFVGGFLLLVLLLKAESAERLHDLLLHRVRVDAPISSLSAYPLRQLLHQTADWIDNLKWKALRYPSPFNLCVLSMHSFLLLCLDQTKHLQYKIKAWRSKKAAPICANMFLPAAKRTGLWTATVTTLTDVIWLLKALAPRYDCTDTIQSC